MIWKPFLKDTKAESGRTILTATIGILFLATLIYAASLPSPPTADDVFVRLIDNRADITSGESIFEVDSPESNFDLGNLSFEFNKAKGNQISSYKKYVNITVLIQKQNITSVFVQKNCSVASAYDCNFYNHTITFFNTTGEGWEPLEGEYLLDKGEMRKVKLAATWKASLGEQAIDWIPVLALKKEKFDLSADQNIKQSKWAWFNTTFNNRINISINFTTLLNASNYSVLVNVTPYSGFNASIRFVNETETGELGFWFFNDTCYADHCLAYVLLDRNASSAQNYSLKMYYNATGTASKSNISAAGLFGDNFATGVDFTNRWQSNNQALYSVTADGRLMMTGTATVADNIQVQPKFNSTSTTNYTIMMRANTTVPSNFFGLYPSVKNLDFDPNPSTQEVVKTNTDIARVTMGENVVTNGGTLTNGHFYVYKATIAPRGNFSIENENGTIMVRNSSVLYANHSQFGLLKYTDHHGSVDWVFVIREYPYVVTQTFGTTEAQPPGAGASDAIPPNINFSISTPANNTLINQANLTINISINASDLKAFVWNWNGTNYSIYDGSLVMALNFNNVTSIGDNETYLKDISAYGNNATFKNGATYNLTGRHGGSLQLDGINDAVTVTDSAAIRNLYNASSGATTSVWIMPRDDGVGDEGRLFDKELGGDDGWIAYVSGQSGESMFLRFQQRFTTSNGVWRTTTRSIAANAWNHVAIVYNATAATNDPLFYINGASVSITEETAPSGVSKDDTANNLAIGGRVISGNEFNGFLDEVMILNRTFSASEVQQLYASTLYKHDNATFVFTTNQSNLVNNFNYTYRAEANDTTGNSNATEYRTVRVNTCAYSSGNFILNAAYNCSLTEDVNLNTNALIVKGGGALILNGGNITNFTSMHLEGNSPTDILTIIKKGGSFRSS